MSEVVRYVLSQCALHSLEFRVRGDEVYGLQDARLLCMTLTPDEFAELLHILRLAADAYYHHLSDAPHVTRWPADKPMPRQPRRNRYSLLQQDGAQPSRDQRGRLIVRRFINDGLGLNPPVMPNAVVARQQEPSLQSSKPWRRYA